MNIIFSEKYRFYNFGQGRSLKYLRAKRFLGRLDKGKFKYSLMEPPRAADEDILLVHSREFLRRLWTMAESGRGYLSPDTPVNKENLEATYYSVEGTVIASHFALNGELAINLFGGAHHAETNDSSGFCIFNDQGVAVRKLQKEGKIKKAVVLDLDAHAGNGTQEIFYNDPTVLTISIHQDPKDFYPGTGFEWQKGVGRGKGFNINIPLPAGTKEPEYLRTLESVLPEIKKFKPDLTLVILGVDTYKADPLAELKLEKESYRKIAQRVKKIDNIAILFAGGYSHYLPELWYEFICGL